MADETRMVQDPSQRHLGTTRHADTDGDRAAAGAGRIPVPWHDDHRSLGAVEELRRHVTDELWAVAGLRVVPDHDRIGGDLVGEVEQLLGH